MPENQDLSASLLYSVGKNAGLWWEWLTRWVELNTAETFIIAGIFILGIGGLSSWLLKKRSEKLEKRRLKREEIGVANQVVEDPSEISFFVSKKSRNENLEQKKSKDPVIREKTRENMAILFNSLKSVKNESAPEAFELNLKEQPFQEFEKLQDQISEVKTDETPQGKFSKMTLEALLVFEEDDLKENLEEWAQRMQKNGRQS